MVHCPFVHVVFCAPDNASWGLRRASFSSPFFSSADIGARRDCKENKKGLPTFRLVSRGCELTAMAPSFCSSLSFFLMRLMDRTLLNNLFFPLICVCIREIRPNGMLGIHPALLLFFYSHPKVPYARAITMQKKKIWDALNGRTHFIFRTHPTSSQLPHLVSLPVG